MQWSFCLVYVCLGHCARYSVLLVHEDHNFVINNQDSTSEWESDFARLPGAEAMALAATVEWAMRGLPAWFMSSSPVDKCLVAPFRWVSPRQ